LDVSLLTVEGNEEFIVQATAGNTNLGGEDLDTSLINHCLAEFKRLHNVDLSQNSRALARLKEPCENAKIALSTSMDTTIFINSFYEGQDLSVTVSRAKFEAMNSSLFENILKPVEMVLSEAKVKKSEVDHVILVGGSSKIPKIQNILSQFFGGKKLNHTVNPDEAIAYGATLQAACLSFGIGSPDINFLLQDVTAFSLGIETNQGMSKIITRNSTLPISHTKRYETVEDNQTSVAINAYQGEEIDVTRNYYLGSFVLNVPALPKGQAKLDVTFRIDASGLLNVKAISLDGGKTESMRITVKNNHLAYEEIAHLAAEQRKMTVTTKRPIKQDQNGLD
jgi:heat shock protein 1/8